MPTVIEHNFLKLKIPFFALQRINISMYCLSTAEIWSYNYKPKDSATYENIHTKTITVNNKAMNLFRFLIYFPCLFNSTFNLFEATHNNLHASFCFVAPFKGMLYFCLIKYFIWRYFGRYELHHKQNLYHYTLHEVIFISCCILLDINRFILLYISKYHLLLILNYN